MKKNALIALMTVAVASLLVASAYAYSEGPIRANIPFSFTVLDKTLPAGEYILTNADDSNPRTMELRSADGRSHVVFETNTAIAKSRPTKAELVFDEVGGRNFLAEVY